ncbi:MAG: pyridoxal phosphate-dependent aminotransferase [Candidatus Micrarchaeota archaeon]
MKASISTHGRLAFVNDRNGREYLLRKVEVWADEAKKQDPRLEIIKLNLGNLSGPIFGAPKEFTSILANHIKNWDGSYFPSRGYSPLIKAIADKQEKETGKRPEDNFVLTGEGGSWFIEKIIGHTMDSRSGILLPDPGYPLYTTEIVKNSGHAFMYGMDKDGNPDILHVRELVREAKSEGIRLKCLVVINPNNPTGAIYSKKSLLELLDVARENDLFVLADEVYYLTRFCGNTPIHISTLADDVPIIQLGSLSKEYQLCGSRVGWGICENFGEGTPSMKIFRKLENDQMGRLSPNGLQLGAAEIVNREEHLPRLREETRLRQEATKKALSAIEGIILGPDPGAAFYRWVGLDLGDPKVTDIGFVKSLIRDTGVVCAPGIGFTLHRKDQNAESFKSSKVHFRVTPLVSEEMIMKAGQKIREHVENLRKGKVKIPK